MGTLVRIVGASETPPSEAIEGLTEMAARRDRLPDAIWGADYLEDASNNYTWQPETITWIDQETGTECWAVWRDKQARASGAGTEYSLMSWSHNGQRLGIISADAVIRRKTDNPDVGNIFNTDYRWVVNADGTGLRACEGYGRGPGAQNNGGFGWASTEDAYYSFGSRPGGEHNDGFDYILYKMTLDANNVVSGAIACDTSTVNSLAKRFGKICINSDDTWIIASTQGTDKVALPTPNPIDCRELFFLNQSGGTWSVSDHWGIARRCYEYYNHEHAKEDGWHDCFLLSSGDQVLLLFSDTNVWWLMDRSGSYADGGPEWTDWDGSSFGEIGCEGTVAPFGEYQSSYFGHPCLDRWGRYALVGTYQFESAYIPGGRDIVGTRIWDLVEHEYLPNFITEVADNGHHTWTGFCDWVAFNGRDDDALLADGMGGCHYEGPPENRYKIINYHREKQVGDNEPYLAFPRPSQSPDGTKTNWQSWWLLSNDGSIPYPCWCVHYYPFPPKISGASKAGGDVRVAFDPTPYTARKWPDDAGSIPEPKEIKYWHLWTSPDKITWTDQTPNGIPFETRTYDHTQTNGTTLHYAMTAREYCDLESRRLGNIWSVTLDGGGAITDSSEDTAYPSDPGAKAAFYTTPPVAPTGFGVALTGEDTHRNLTWTGSTSDNVRYHNIYYRSDGVSPTANRAYLIGSVHRSVSEWLDWQCQNTGNDRYGLTAVDRQGNESTIVHGA